MRVIDADRMKEKMATTLEVLKHIFPPGEQEAHLISAFATVGLMADDCPTIDAVPVKHGEWIVKGQDIFCSVCGEESAYTWHGASKFLTAERRWTEKGKTMLTSEGYCLTYYKNKNQIIICLPQAYETITNTVEKPVDRRTDVEETDLWVLLNIAQLIFHKGER